MSNAEIGRLTRWEIFTLLVSPTDEDGQIHVDEIDKPFYYQMRDRALEHGFDFRRAIEWAAEKVQIKKESDEDEQWQKA
jgi:hypothetical protein